MQANSTEYRTIVLAGLLHDIGKLLQRGSSGGTDIEEKHPAISACFVNEFADCFSQICDSNLLKTLVQKHHQIDRLDAEFSLKSISDENTRTLTSLISLADNLSSAESGGSATNYLGNKATPLASVLERANNSELASPDLRFHPNPLPITEKLHKIFPEKFEAYSNDESGKFSKDFREEFRNIFVSGHHVVHGADYESLLTHLYSLLAKYAWCIPSNSEDGFPDVSLFDHLRTTAAIASCLYLYHLSNKSMNEKNLMDGDAQRFLILAGDISGIQNYIFDITSTGAGGVARRLRARSLYVQLCTDIAAHHILRKLEMPIPIHTLMNSGGNFYILLPNIEGVKKGLQESQQEMDDWFLKVLNGELVLNLATISFGDDGFKTQKEENSRQAGFGAVAKAVNEQLDKKKKRRFAEVLQENQNWQENAFQIPVTFKGEESCQSCHKFPQVKDSLCRNCISDRDIGTSLPDARMIAFYDESNAGDIKVFNHSVSVDSINKDIPPYLVMKINDTDLSGLTPFPSLFKYLAKTIPLKDDCAVCQKSDSRIATFECIAKRSQGDALLGFLKMDVDNLGETAIFGLKPYDTISRFATFSRMLDLYFSGWVENISQKNGDIYTIFSGGDDLFLVGPWDKILNTAGVIRDDFRRYTNNANLTISAGVVIAGHNYPIGIAADTVKDALDASKKEKDKNRITVLGRTLTWEDWRKVSAEWIKLKDIVKREKVPSAFLYNLQTFGEMWHKYKYENDVMGLRYHPLLSYSIARTVKSKDFPELYKWALKLLKFPPEPQNEFILDNLSLLTKLIILSKRGGKNERI